MKGQAIVDEMLKAYRSLKSYQDSGYVIRTRYPGTQNEESNRKDFTTAFKRGPRDLFRFQWRHEYPGQPNNEWVAAIWSNGESVFGHYPATGTKLDESIGSAMRSGAGDLSSGAAEKAPSLLMQEIEEDCDFPLTEFEYVGVETVLDESCYHVRRIQAHHEGPRNTDLWISEKRFALRKVLECSVSDSIRFGAWHAGLLGDDPAENERIIEAQRIICRMGTQKSIVNWVNIEDWRKKALEMVSEPCPQVAETFYAEVVFNGRIEDEERVFGD